MLHYMGIFLLLSIQKNEKIIFYPFSSPCKQLLDISRFRRPVCHISTPQFTDKIPARHRLLYNIPLVLPIQSTLDKNMFLP